MRFRKTIFEAVNEFIFDKGQVHAGGVQGSG